MELPFRYPLVRGAALSSLECLISAVFRQAHFWGEADFLQEVLRQQDGPLLCCRHSLIRAAVHSAHNDKLLLEKCWMTEWVMAATLCHTLAAADLLTIDARVTRSALLPRFAWLAALAYEAFRTRNASNSKCNISF